MTTEYCKSHNELNVSSLISGFIASIMTSDTASCDGISHPWLIIGHPGQRIQLTLFDFATEEMSSLYRRRQKYQHHDLVDICRQYGIIQENGRDKTTAFCGSEKRISSVFQSTGNRLKLWVTAGSGPKDLKRFVIQYQS